MKRGTDANPAFTFYANDALSWEPIHFLSDQMLGQAFRLIVWATKNGGRLPLNHPILKVLDPTVLEMCTRTVDDHVEVIAPHDLPKLMAKRKAWAASKKAGADAAGRDASGKFRGRS